MNFLQPAYLWALAAMVVPLAIHLLSRKEGKTIRMGSLRHVRETPTRQFRSVRLNEYLLLMLRMIVLGLLSFFLAGWYLDNFKDHSKWLVIEPGMEARQDLQPLFDSLSGVGFERRMLEPGFPEKPASSSTDYAARIEELNQLPVEEVVVVATNRLVGFRGPRVSLPEHIKWIEISAGSTEAEVNSVSISKDSVRARLGSFKPGGTSFSNTRGRGQGKRARDTVKVAVAWDQEFETDKAVVEAVLRVVKKQAADVLDFSIVKRSAASPTGGWLIWLSDSPPPKASEGLIFLEQELGANLIEKVGTGRYRLTNRLNSEVATNGNLAVHLSEILFYSAETEAAANVMDRRIVPMRAAFASEGNSGTAVSSVRGNQRSTQYLVGVLMFFFLLERIISYRRNQ